jgi:hypothetical protein
MPYLVLLIMKHYTSSRGRSSMGVSGRNNDSLVRWSQYSLERNLTGFPRASIGVFLWR